MNIGILAVQGAFAEHSECISKLGAEPVLIRNTGDIHNIDGLILPGGESTVQHRLLNETGLFQPLREMISNGLPVLATCAGMIILAQHICGGEEPCFGLLPVSVCRNAYGRQLGSFSTVGNIGSISDFPMRFIRAPYVERVCSDNVRILNITDDRITAVRYKSITALAFHPELTDDLRIHREFLDTVGKSC